MSFVIRPAEAQGTHRGADGVMASDYMTREMPPELYTLMPFQHRFASLSAGLMHYVDEGEGEAVVMLHGNPTWGFLYRHLVKGLCHEKRVLVPDHLGMGFSSIFDPRLYPYDLQRRVDDLSEFIEKVLGRSQRFSLVVHDWGGMIGLAYAVSHVDKIEKIVILNTGAFEMPKESSLPWQIAVCRNAAVGRPLVVHGNAFVKGLLATGVYNRETLTGEVKAGYHLPYNSSLKREAIYRFVRDIPLKKGDRSYDLMKFVEEGLPRLANKKIALCFGLRDYVFNRHFLARFQALLPQSEVKALPQAGHLVLEDAHEEILPWLQTFFSSR